MPTLDWIGKDAVRGHHQEVPFRLLEEQEEMQVGDPEAENLLVQGDNLHALKALLPYYAGEVDCVYIDPPYNTGNEDWAYNDNVDSPEIKEWLGKTVGEEAEDLSRHDKWLCMMYPRVRILHELLAEDGSFWMTIDDSEVQHARAFLDEIFGRKNFIIQFAWQKRQSPDSDETFATSTHDHILCYAKDREKCNFNKFPRTEKADSRYSNPDNDPRGPWTSSDLTRREYREHDFYPIETPSGREVTPASGRSWSVPREKFEELKNDNRIWFGVDGSAMPRRKRFLSEVEDGIVPTSWWGREKFGDNQEAKKELREILYDTDDLFETPKPTRLMEQILQIATDPGDLVLDSFAGTGTTGHAVLRKNNQDVGNRKFILVEMQEDVAKEVAYRRLKRAVDGYAYEGKEKETLMEKKITVRKIKKGNKIYAESEEIKKNNEENYDKIRRETDDGVFRLYGQTNIEEQKEGLGGGFRYFTLGSPLVNSDGIVRDEVEYEELARHVYYTETRNTLPQDHEMSPPLVSAQDGMALYLLRGEESSVLSRSLLKDLLTNGEIGNTVVYGSACRVGEAMLKQHSITFRQLPYDVRVS